MSGDRTSNKRTNDPNNPSSHHTLPNRQSSFAGFSIFRPFDPISSTLASSSSNLRAQSHLPSPPSTSTSHLPTAFLTSVPNHSSTIPETASANTSPSKSFLSRHQAANPSGNQVKTSSSFASSLTSRLTRKKPLKKGKSKRSISLLEDGSTSGIWSALRMEQQSQPQPPPIASMPQNNSSSNLNSSPATSGGAGTSSPPPPLPPPSARLSSSQSFINVNEITKPVKRNIVIQRDARGYGIRISGDNPVSVESVTPDGAAYRAGVRAHDQILKINGSLATRMSHTTVVDMIKNCGGFVNLQVLTLPLSAQLQAAQKQQSQQSQLSQVPPQSPPTHSNNSINNSLLGMDSPAGAGGQPVLSSSLSPTNSPTPNQYGRISTGNISANSSLSHSNSFQNSLVSSPLTPGPPTIGLNRQITNPLPVPENTQKEYSKSKVETLEKYIKSESEYLAGLSSDKHEQIDQCKKRIANFRLNLATLLQSNEPQSAPVSTNPSTFDTPTSSSNIIPKGAGAKTYAIRKQFGERFDSDDEESQQILPIGNEVSFSSQTGSVVPTSIDDVYRQPYDGLSPPAPGSAHFVPNSPPTRPSFSMATTGNTSSSSTPKSKRDSKNFDHSNLPISLENIHEHSLRVARYLLQSKTIPHAMLFLVTTKRIFPEIVASAARKFINISMIGNDNQINGLRQLIQKWASQIMSTWVVKESPLYFHEFSQQQMDQYDHLLSQFTVAVASRISHSGPAANPFEVFLDETREIVGAQLLEFQQAVQSKPEMMLTKPKEDLQATIEQLLLSVHGSASPGLKLDIRDVDPIFDQLIHNATESAVTTMAVVSGLLTVGHFEFGYSSKHLLLSDVNACIQQIPTVSGLSSIVASTFNPVMKLSDVSSSSKKGNHKRNVSLPASTRPPALSSGFPAFDSSTGVNSAALPAGGITEQEHYFVVVNDLTAVEYCRGKCQLTLWGDQYNYQCVKCKLLAHFWCLKQAANDHLCVRDGVNNDGVTMRHSNANSGDNRKKRTSKIEPHKKTSVIEKFASKALKRPTQEIYRSESSSSTSTTISLSSSSEGSDYEDFGADDDQSLIGMGRIGKNPSFSGGSTVSVTSPTVQPATMPMVESGNVPRSGSFNQRRRGKMTTSSSTPRKRSDPALTTRNMSTITGQMLPETSQPPLTSAHSSGALMSGSAGHFHHSASFCGDGVGGAGDAAHGLKSSNSFSPHFPMLNRKPMTASDSSLLSSTHSNPTPAHHSSPHQQSHQMSQSQNPSATQLHRQSSSTSQRSSKRSERKKTADSAIHMDANITSDEDAERSETTYKPRPDENDPNCDPIVDDQYGPPPPLPPPSNPRSDPPPPLPPRPVQSITKMQTRHQVKREIIDTEAAHVQSLQYIRDVYYYPLKKERLLPKEELSKIFLNTRKVQSVHTKISEQLNEAYAADEAAEKDKTGDSHYFERKLCEILNGRLGQSLERQVVYFCFHQKTAMEIWNKKKGQTQLKALFDNDLKAKEMPNDPNARLNLNDLMAKVFQRPVRYSLLLERLLGATPKDTEASSFLQQALVGSKRLGDKINERMTKQELQMRLKEIIKKIDSRKEDNPLLVGEHELIHEGNLTWKISKNKAHEVLGVLTDKMMLIVMRDSGDRFSLKKPKIPTSNSHKLLKLDIRLDDLLVRPYAVNKSGFLFVSNSQDIFYEFESSNPKSATNWITKVEETIQKYQKSLANQPVRHSNAGLRDLPSMSTNHGRSKSSLADLEHFTSVSGSSSNLGQSPVNGTLPPNFVNRPLPEVPGSSDPLPGTSTTPPRNGQSHSPPTGMERSSSTATTRYAGSIGEFVEKNDLVEFNEVKVTPKPKVLKAEIVNESADQSVEQRFRTLADRVEHMKTEMKDLLVVCDVEGLTVENDVKEKLFFNLLNMAIRIDNNNRPTREPFSELLHKSQNYIRSLNQRNSPVHDHGDGDDQSGNSSDGRNNNGNSSKDDDQRKSQDSLQRLEELADLQIAEFENKAKSSNNSDGEENAGEPSTPSTNPFENGTISETPANPFYFGSDPRDFELITANVTTAIVDDTEVVLTEVLTSGLLAESERGGNEANGVSRPETHENNKNHSQHQVPPPVPAHQSKQSQHSDQAWAPESQVKPKAERGVFIL